MTEQLKHPGPLEGIRVLELGQLIAGPFTGCLLGYYGAEVIKVGPMRPARVSRQFVKELVAFVTSTVFPPALRCDQTLVWVIRSRPCTQPWVS